MGVVAKELASCEVIVVDVCRKGKEGDWSGFGWVTSSKKRASLVIYINKKSFDNLVIETKEERFNSYGYDLVNMVWHEICHLCGQDDGWLSDSEEKKVIDYLCIEIGEEASNREAKK